MHEVHEADAVDLEELFFLYDWDFICYIIVIIRRWIFKSRAVSITDFKTNVFNDTIPFF